MTHEDTGNYAGKRRGAELNETIAAKIKEKISEKRISCAEAHSIAAELSVAPADVGAVVDLIEVRIIKCQLGLFGYGKEKNIPVLSDKTNPDIELAIKSSLINDDSHALPHGKLQKSLMCPSPLSRPYANQ